uniref:Endo/exonuclease/phosphatase domain-containing protein n=1 Tax=Schistocephalus solidus TaxID=70667 RepID=A0A183TIM1_SCHSO
LLSNRPERRTTSIPQERAHFKMNITALGEASVSEQRKPVVVGTGCAFFWSGILRTGQREVGVIFSGRLPGPVPYETSWGDSAFCRDLSEKGLKEVGNRTKAHPVPRVRSPRAKNKFYEHLTALLATVPKAGKLLVLGDFSVRVGTEHVAWEEVMVSFCEPARNIASCRPTTRERSK